MWDKYFNYYTSESNHSTQHTRVAGGLMDIYSTLIERPGQQPPCFYKDVILFSRTEPNQTLWESHNNMTESQQKFNENQNSPTCEGMTELLFH